MDTNERVIDTAGASVSRRRMLGLSAAAVAASALPFAAAEAEAAVWNPPVVNNPDEALNRLLEGNSRFYNGRPIAPHRDMARLQSLAKEQKPFAAVLSCADSRVPVELVFDQGLGDIFVCRSAGNVISPELVGSFEFGTAVLGARVLMVLGHTDCGAVKAAISGGPVPGQISTLYSRIRPAVTRGNGQLDPTTEENVRVQAELLRDASPVIADLVKQGKLKVVGGVYNVANGVVRVLA